MPPDTATTAPAPTDERDFPRDRDLILDCAAHAFATAQRRMHPLKPLTAWLKEFLAAIDVPLAAVIGPDSAIVADETANGSAIARALREFLLRQPVPLEEDGLEQRLSVVERLFDLSPLDGRILGILAHVRRLEALETLCTLAAPWKSPGFEMESISPVGVASVTGLPLQEVTQALAEGGRLAGAGLVTVEPSGRLNLLGRVFRFIASGGNRPARDAIIGTPAPATLRWADFAHIGPELDTIAAVTRGALAAGEKGVNILLWGPPGTGKTELAKTLAAHLGVPLFPVGEVDRRGGEPERYERLGALRASQRLLALGGPGIVLFDEAEDLLVPPSGPFNEEITQGSRVFLHRQLETNPVPVIWALNNLDDVDPAIRRRMACCVEMAVPPLGVRRGLWSRLALEEGIALPAEEALYLARTLRTPPSLVRGALRAARLAGGDPVHVRRVVEGMTSTLDGGILPPPEAEALADFDPALINADTDMAGLADRLATAGEHAGVSILLSGPSGSGKAGWAHHLAGHLGLEVITHPAASLLASSHVERMIAAVFSQARKTQSMLLLTGAEAVLFERGWPQASQRALAAMAAWLDQQDGLVICTVGDTGRLDPAALRRFSLRVTFRFLTQAQAGRAFRTTFGQEAPAALDDVTRLTPADFRAVKRKAALLDDGKDSKRLVQMLAAEAGGRTALPGESAVGFGRVTPGGR
ncbi:MAG: AAA family ATPase [Acetobacteraceae bacterium]